MTHVALLCINLRLPSLPSVVVHVARPVHTRTRRQLQALQQASQLSSLPCRKLKMNNKKVQDTVVNVDGALELLQACGFELVFEDGTPEPQPQSSSQTEGSSQSHQAAAQGESGTTGYLWFPEEAELWLLQAALQLLQPLVPLPFAKSSNSSTSQLSTSGEAPIFKFALGIRKLNLKLCLPLAAGSLESFKPFKGETCPESVMK